MRLFAISDIHTDYKENLEWVTAHADRERANRAGRECPPGGQSGQVHDHETVLLVAGDVCDDVLQFTKVRRAG